MEVRVEKVGNRIHLRSQYHPDIPIKCKRIPGYRWAPGAKVWTFPLDYGTCLLIRQEFKHALIIGPDLKAWARAAKKRYEDLHTLSSANRADLGRVAEVSPALATAMARRPYQQVGAAWMARAGQALLADHPGLGKTLQAMGAVVERQVTGPILVFAPKTACIVTWVEELEKWLPDDMVWCVTALDAAKRRQQAFENIKQYYEDWHFKARQATLPDGTTLISNHIESEQPEPRLWVLCNIEMARCKPLYDDPEDEWKVTGRQAKFPGLFDIDWATVIVDESHKLLITRYSQAKKQTQQRAGMSLLPAREDAMRIAMSGTPMRGKRYNLWGTLNWLRPDLYPSFWNWVKRYFDVYESRHGFVISDELNEDMLNQLYLDLDSIMLRRTKDEVLSDLPPKMYAGVRLEGQSEVSAPGHWLEMTSPQREAYLALERDAAVELEGGSLLANGTLAIRTRLKQFASATWKMVDGELMPCRPSNKLDWLEEFLRDRGILGEDEYGDGKVIVASQSTRLVNFFARELEELGVKSHVLTGETKPQRRREMVNEFQGPGGPRVFLFNTTAGGVSLTLDAADDVVILDELDVPDDQEQVEDRAHRASSMHQVMIHYVRSLETIEVDIALKVGEQEFDQKSLLDARRGVKIAKEVVDDWKWPGKGDDK